MQRRCKIGVAFADGFWDKYLLNVPDDAEISDNENDLLAIVKAENAEFFNTSAIEHMWLISTLVKPEEKEEK